MKYSRRIYYAIKPFIPYSVRLRIRHWHARRQRQTAGGIWPVLPGSEKAPKNWPGWPIGKHFAVVLTHDVEGQAGLDKCREVMALEEKHGFHSSFNFVPEGDYSVSLELREELRNRGFEVGVHDLHHDGTLYRNREGFRKSAQRINDYLKEWGAVGFRAGFMFHNLEWLHDLKIEYDASTFDTDPFEPQPDGVGTIFPFWVPYPASMLGNLHNGNGSHRTPNNALDSNLGYVEFPYTLVQDSTLFMLLGERNPDIWLKKVDWLAQNGGMVLVNTHPDYMAIRGAGEGRWQFPIELYEQLLEYIRSRYFGAYWHALPREVAQFVRKAGLNRPTTAQKGAVTEPQLSVVNRI
jgi:hypothetical protein